MVAGVDDPQQVLISRIPFVFSGVLIQIKFLKSRNIKRKCWQPSPQFPVFPILVKEEEDESGLFGSSQ